MREYLYFTGWIIAFATAVVFFDVERYQIALFALVSAAWLVFKIVTDHQEKKLYEELDDLTDEEYESFLDEAEEEGLVERAEPKRNE